MNGQPGLGSAALLAAVCGFAAAGCGGSEGSQPPGATVVDDKRLHAAEVCAEPDEYDLFIDLATTGLDVKPPFTNITGVMSLPEPIGEGHPIGYALVGHANPDSGLFSGGGMWATNAGLQMTYSIRSMPRTAGLIFGVFVDGSGNWTEQTGVEALHDGGDLAGYFPGTVGDPIQDPAGAAELPLDTDCTPGVDVGLAVVP